MYHGLHNTNANPLQHTYDQLQNRAIQELNNEIKRLKDIIVDKDADIGKLREITNEGTLQKKLASILEENNELKLESKRFRENESEIKEISDSLKLKDDEIYRLQEKLNILDDECKELMEKNQTLSQQIAGKDAIIERDRLKDDTIDELNGKISKYEQLIHDLKNATKVNDLEDEVKSLKAKISTMHDEQQLLTENNKNLTKIYDELKGKYTKLLTDFESNLEENQLKFTKKISDLNFTSSDLTKQYQSEIGKTKALKKQIKDLQEKYNEMESLNIKLIKGYNLTDVINDLQNERNQRINLQNQLKQSTKRLAKKEKTNLVLLDENRRLSKTDNIDALHPFAEDEESTYFDHTEEMDSLRQHNKSLLSQIDALESDKYKLLMQLHEVGDLDGHSDHHQEDSLLVSGLDRQQQAEVKQFVKKIRRKSLMPSILGSDSDDEDERIGDPDHIHRSRDMDTIHNLKAENEKLREWKDTLMNKLMETQQTMKPMQATHAMQALDNNHDPPDHDQAFHEEDATAMNTQNSMLHLSSKQSLMNAMGITLNARCDSEPYLIEIKQLIEDHAQYVKVVMDTMDKNKEALNGDPQIDLNEHDLKEQVDELQSEIETLKGFKARHSKIEGILKEKEDSEFIKKVDEVTRENMVLIVSERNLIRKCDNIKKQHHFLFAQYAKLLKYLMNVEDSLFQKLISSRNEYDNLRIFTTSLLESLSNEMVPIEQYKNLELECQSLMQNKEHLLNLVDQFQSYSIQYFKSKRDHIALQNQLLAMKQDESSKEEAVYNAELVDDGNAQQIKASIAITEKECAFSRQKYENAMDHIKEMEQHSSMLHDQINELRSICMDQNQTISSMKKSMEGNHCELKEYKSLQSQFERVKAQYDQKVAEIEQHKLKTELAVSSLQRLQSKLLMTLNMDEDGDDDDGDGDDERKYKNIGKILKNAQEITTKLMQNEQTIKSLEDRANCLEVAIMKKEQAFNTLQAQHFAVQRAHRILEANYNCVYSQTLHKVSTKYLSEIDNLRNVNEDLYEYLNAEQRKTKELYDEMIEHKTIIESFKIKVENLNDLLSQFQVKGTDSEQKQYLKTWQSKCTNLEIKEIELLNQNDSLQNEINFLRNESKKYVVNIGSLQKKLSISLQELQNTKQEIIKKDTMTIEDLREIVTQTESKNVQTDSVNVSKQEADDAEIGSITIDGQTMDALRAKISSLQHHIVSLQGDSQSTEQRVKSATEGLQIMLKTAKDTISNLQSLLAQKNESIEQYKNMIDKLLQKLKEQQSKYSQHIAVLKRKHDTDQQRNDRMVLSEIQKIEHQHGDDGEWIGVSEMKTTLHEKESVITKLQHRNAELAKEREHGVAKVNILNTRIDEYHHVIQELNDKIKSLSESLSSFKTKLNTKKKENVNLRKAVNSMKSDLEESNLKSERKEKDENGHRDTGQEMDEQMKKMENEYKILRSSLKSEIDDNKGRLTASEVHAKDLGQKNRNLMANMDKMRETMQSKSNLVHKLQVQISKIQKDKITMQEKHSLSLKLNRKKIADLEQKLETASKQLSSSLLSEEQSKAFYKYKAQCSNLKKTLNEKQRKMQSIKSEVDSLKKKEAEMRQNMASVYSEKKVLTENVSRLQLEIKSLKKKRECKPSKEEMDEPDSSILQRIESESVNWRTKYEEAQRQILDLKRVVEIEQMKELRTLRMENQSMKRKQDLLSGKTEDRSLSDKQIAKLLDEIEAKSKVVIDLEIKVNELEFEREDLEIKCKKLQKEIDQHVPTANVNGSGKMVISSRNDPELQNLLDSMRFIINKLKKENQSLKSHTKGGGNNKAESARITNLLKENRSLKRKVAELSELGQHHGDEYLSSEIDQKRLEIERISTLNRRLNKDNLSLKEMNDKLKRGDSFKNDEIAHLRKMVESERDSARQQVQETNMIWKRKMTLNSDDLSRYKKIKKQLEAELKHKNEINEKMSTEIKALIELIDHTKKMNTEQLENDKTVVDKNNAEIESLKKENEELRSELSAFDVDFFNEIEDLKYREAQAQQTIADLQSQLQTFNI